MPQLIALLRLTALCALALTAFAANAQTSDQAPVLDDYQVNPGDVLFVSVWKEEGLEREVLVRPDGKFSFPLAGDVDARGRSVEEIRIELTQRLERYIPDLVVSVAVIGINGNKVFVLGQVNRPGEIIANPQIDVMQAISIAGGTTPFAELNDISILRRTAAGPVSIDFRYNDVLKGKRLEQNIMLKAGDVVVVP